MRISSVLEHTRTYLRVALTRATPATLDERKSGECSGLLVRLLVTISYLHTTASSAIVHLHDQIIFYVTLPVDYHFVLADSQTIVFKINYKP